MRSAAKPFQALPVIEDGAADRFALSSEELALACASHNSERRQVELVRGLLARIGCGESDLACGPHRPLSQDLALPTERDAASDDVPRSPVASNCSGKFLPLLMSWLIRRRSSSFCFASSSLPFKVELRK